MKRTFITLFLLLSCTLFSVAQDLIFYKTVSKTPIEENIELQGDDYGRKWELYEVIFPNDPINPSKKYNVLAPRNYSFDYVSPSNAPDIGYTTSTKTLVIPQLTPGGRKIHSIAESSLYNLKLPAVRMDFLINDDSFLLPTVFHSNKSERRYTTDRNIKVNQTVKKILVGSTIRDYFNLVAKYAEWQSKSGDPTPNFTETNGIITNVDYNQAGLVGGMINLNTLGPDGTEEGTFIIPYGAKSIGTDAFAGTKVKKVVFINDPVSGNKGSSSIQEIGIGAFSGCIELTQFVDADIDGSNETPAAFENLETIHTIAFNRCSKLTQFSSGTLPKLTSIGQQAFAFTSRMTAFADAKFNGASLNTIGKGAFMCSGIETFGDHTSTGLTSFEQLTTIDDFAFAGSAIKKFSVTTNNRTNLPLLTRIGKSAFRPRYPLSIEKIDVRNDSIDFLPNTESERRDVPSELIAFGTTDGSNELNLRGASRKTIEKRAFAFCNRFDVIRLEHIDSIGIESFRSVNAKAVYAYDEEPIIKSDVTSFDFDSIHPKDYRYEFGTLRFGDIAYEPVPTGVEVSQGVERIDYAKACTENKKAIKYKATRGFFEFRPFFYFSEEYPENRFGLKPSVRPQRIDVKDKQNKPYKIEAEGTYSVKLYRTYNVGTSNWSSFASPFVTRIGQFYRDFTTDAYKANSVGPGYYFKGLEGTTIKYYDPNPSRDVNFEGPDSRFFIVNYREGATGVPTQASFHYVGILQENFGQEDDVVKYTDDNQPIYNSQEGYGGADVFLRANTNKKAPLWNADNDADKALYVYTKDGWKRVFTVDARQSNIKPFRFVLLVKLNSTEKELQDRIDAAVVAYKNANNGSWDGDLNKLNLSSTDRANAVTSLGLTFDTPVVNTIDGVEEDVKTTYTPGIYNLQGQRMGDDFNSLPQGIYIVNGKKVIKK